MDIVGHPFRHGQVVLRLLATMGLVGFVLGVPLLLVTTHATPPSSEIHHLLVHPMRIPRVLTGRFGDGAVSKLICSIAWLAWAWLAICIGVEMVSLVRGRVPRAMPASKHVQWLVKCLVGASLAVGFPGRHASPLRLQVVAISAPNPYGYRGELPTKFPNPGNRGVAVRGATPSDPARLATKRRGRAHLRGQTPRHAVVHLGRGTRVSVELAADRCGQLPPATARW